MKYNVRDFLIPCYCTENDLSQKVLSFIVAQKKEIEANRITPATECVLIAKSNRLIAEKIAALEERYATYSERDLHEERPSFAYSGEFRNVLGKYIEWLKYAMNLRWVSGDQIEFEAQCEDGEERFSTFAAALEWLGGYFDDQKIWRWNDDPNAVPNDSSICYHMNDYGIMAIHNTEMREIDLTQADYGL